MSVSCQRWPQWLLCLSLLPYLTINAAIHAAPVVEKIGELEGKTVDVWTTKGEFLSDLEITTIKMRDQGAVSFTCKVENGKKRQIPSNQVREIYLDNMPQDVQFDVKEKALLISSTRRDARKKITELGEGYLLSAGKSFSPRLSKKDQQKQYAAMRSRIEELTAKFPKGRFRVAGTGPCFLFTDAPPQIASQVDHHLSAAYLEMCSLMGLGPCENPLNGCYVFMLFSQEQDMFDFLEQKDGKRPKPGLAAIAYQNDGARWVVTNGGFKDAPSASAVHLVDAFLQYGGSDVTLPEWIRQGVDLMTRSVSNENRDLKDRHNFSLKQLKSDPTLPADFFDAAPGSETYKNFQAIQLDLVQRMYLQDQNRFGMFVRCLKLGIPVEESLQQCYNMTVEDMLREYGKSVGVPELHLAKP